MKFPRTNGFGKTGLAVTNAGRVFRFDQPFTRIVLNNPSGGKTVYVGFNEIISGAVGAESTDTEKTWPNGILPTITAADALGKGIRLEAGKDLELFFAVDATGERKVYSIWLITDGTDTATIYGGAAGF